MLGVVLVMALAMIGSTATLASTPVRLVVHAAHTAADHPLLFFGDGGLRIRTLLFGFVFAAWVSIALAVTRAWHGVRPTGATAFGAAASVSVGQTLILLAVAACCAMPGLTLPSGSALAFVIYVILTAAASVLGASLVARAARLVTGRREPLIARSMLLWAACWVGIQQALERTRVLANASEGPAAGVAPAAAKIAHAFAPELVLMWQLPLGIAVAAWFVRTHSAPAAGFRNRGEAIRWWGKATALVVTALLLLTVAVTAIERNRVPVEEEDVVPDPDPEGVVE